MNYLIREARSEDMPRVLELIRELAHFEKEKDAVELTVQDLIRDGFGGQPLFQCFVADVNGVVEGMALVYPRYSTWKGPAIHLEDLIIADQMRGSGLGTALLDHVIKYGYKLGVKRIGWEVLDWNEPAIRFYENKGARVLRDWDVVQLDEGGIQQYIENI
ncbi:MAG: GNAT family N-acetyltransferase [Flavobacteriaceae bacterium]